MDAHLIVTSAGVSVGDRDYVRSTLEELGAEIKFWRIRMRPGAPVAFGMLGETPWIGLPGNPVSCMVAFELFVRPALRLMMGYTGLFRDTIRARVLEPIRLGPPLTHFLRVTLDSALAPPGVRPTGPQGSGVLTSMAKADALLVVPENRAHIDAGEELSAIPLSGTRYVPEPPW